MKLSEYRTQAMRAAYESQSPLWRGVNLCIERMIDTAIKNRYGRKRLVAMLRRNGTRTSSDPVCLSNYTSAANSIEADQPLCLT